MTYKSKSLFMTIMLAAICLCIGFTLGEGHQANPQQRSIKQAFDAASKAVKSKCTANTLGCNDLHAVTIDETDCSQLAPQNGSKGRCGFWTIGYTATDNKERLRVFSVVVYYDGSIKLVNEGTAVN